MKLKSGNPWRFAFVATAAIALILLSSAAAFAASISGTVADSGGPIQGISVSAWQWNSEVGDWQVAQTVSTAAGGGYSIAGLAAGDYRVEFKDAAHKHVTEFYNDVASPTPFDDRAQTIPLTASQNQTGINALLAAGGRIGGTVTAATGGAPLGGISVEAFVFAQEQGGVWSSYTATTTAGSGDYLLTGLPEGDVRLRFRDTSGHYVTELYNNVAAFNPEDARATAVPVTEGGLTDNIDAALAGAGGTGGTGSLAGIVRGPDGQPRQGVAVGLFKSGPLGWELLASTSTAAGGTYSFSGLAAAGYRLRFSVADGSLLTECYDDVPTSDVASLPVDSVNVSEGGSVTDVNAQLSSAGVITGTVTDEEDSGLSDIEVTAFRYDSGSASWVSAGTDTTDSDGYYRIGELVTGSYRLRFADPLGGYETECFDDIKTINVGDPDVQSVPVTQGSVALGTDAVLSIIAPPPVPKDTYEPDDTSLAARTFGAAFAENHSIDTLADEDWYCIQAKAGVQYDFATSGDELLDTRLQLRNAAGVVLMDEEDAEGFASISYLSGSTEKLYLRATAKYPGYYTIKATLADKAAPVTTTDAVASYVGQAVIALTASDNHSGVATTSYQLDGGAWVKGTSITVNEVGHHTLAFYSVDNAGNTEVAKSASFSVGAPPVAAKPKVSLGTPVAPKTMKKNKSYTVYGSLKPRHTSGSKPVRIYKYKKVSGKWVGKGYTTAKAYNYSSYSRYKASIKLTSKGSWRLRAYAPADSKHAATWSTKYDYVTAK